MVLKKLNKGGSCMIPTINIPPGQSTATTEKISDGIRSMFKKVRLCFRTVAH